MPSREQLGGREKLRGEQLVAGRSLAGSSWGQGEAELVDAFRDFP